MPPKGSKSPAPRAKASRSKSPPPPTTTTTTTATAVAASPEKASPKRAASASKKAPVTPLPKKSASPKPSSKKSKKQLEAEDDAELSDAVVSDSDNEEEALPPQTQNQLSQTAKKQQASSPPASPRPAPSPKGKKSAVVAEVSKKNEDAAAEDVSAEEKPSFFAATHDSVEAKKETLEAAKRCTELPKAVKAMYAYLKKKASDLAKNKKNGAAAAATPQNSVDDVLALFGPQNNGLNANGNNNNNVDNSFADNNGVPVVEVSVEFNFIRAPKPSRIPWSCVLPNPVHDIDKSICLITPAPQERYRNQIENESAPVQAPANIQKIMDVKKLEGRFQDPVARRALAKSYSAFWVHNEVETFPRVLTGEFMSHHFPVWVNGKKSLHINQRLQRTLSCVMLPRQGHDNVTVVVGHTKLTEDQLVDNIRSFCGHVVALLEATWKDVLAIRLSFRDFGTGTGADRRVNLPFYAHDFKESHGLGSADVAMPKPVRLPTNMRLILAAASDDAKKESGSVRGRDGEAAKKDEAAASTVKATVSTISTEQPKKEVPTTASNNNNAKKVAVAAAPSPKKPNNSAAAAAKKKEEETVESDDDDEIPQIDATASPKAASPKKPAPKGKKASAKK